MTASRSARRTLAVSIVALAAVLAGLPHAATTVRARSHLQRQLVEDFEDLALQWRRVVGPGSLTRGDSTPEPEEGTAYAELQYAFTAGAPSESVYIGPNRNLPLLGLPRTLSVRVYSERPSFNTVYMQIRDATGEIHHHRLGNLSFTGWSQFSFQPGSDSAAAVQFGDGDGVLDLPIEVYRLLVSENCGVSMICSDTVAFDEIASEYEAWDDRSAAATPGQ